jgi:ribosome biogenesis GTPase
MEEGVVVKSTGSWYHVRLKDDTILECRIIGRFRLAGKKLTNPVAVGDRVMIEREKTDDKGVIKTILERDNYVVRQSPRKKHDLHLLASNIDQAVLIVTIIEPNLKQGFIDRFLLMTEPYNIPTVVVFNKADLYGEAALMLYQDLEDIYTTIGYQTLLVSALDGTGLEAFKACLKNKTSLISGQSGVGKSSLINAIQPKLDLRVGDISDYSGKGQHTTTFAEMYDLSFGGYIIDTPGIKTLGFNHLEPQDIAHNFREFFDLSSDCKFGGSCLHRNEPGCAVKAAVEHGEVSELRYLNYLTLLEEAEEQNYWERHKNF